MRVLLHVCCGPCAAMPLRELLNEGHEVLAWFYNPNIHPLAEYLRRRQGAKETAAAYGLALHVPPPLPAGQGPGKAEYDVTSWCREALAHPDGRCRFCRESRFLAAARAARAYGCDAFTSSLLYSRRQDHDGMRAAGENAATHCALPFLYRDFRPFWQEGIAASKERGIYRQQYCGCVFSEEDRYTRELEKTITEAACGACP